jgi:hypothetical protein
MVAASTVVGEMLMVVLDVAEVVVTAEVTVFATEVAILLKMVLQIAVVEETFAPISSGFVDLLAVAKILAMAVLVIVLLPLEN